MTAEPEPAGRPSGRAEQQAARRHPPPGQRLGDPYRPEYSVVLAVSSQMRTRYPDSPLSLEEALERGTRQPDTGTPATHIPQGLADAAYR